MAWDLINISHSDIFQKGAPSTTILPQLNGQDALKRYITSKHHHSLTLMAFGSTYPNFNLHSDNVLPIHQPKSYHHHRYDNFFLIMDINVSYPGHCLSHYVYNL